MELEFLQPWAVFAAVALLLCAVGVGLWKKRPSAVLFVLGAAAFCAGAARPRITQSDTSVTHALVVDVSASMRSRGVDDFARATMEGMRLPSNHAIVRFELSDALRGPDSVRGDGTVYARIGDLADDERINGEVWFITDGRGDMAELREAIAPSRLILLRPPPPDSPDATVLDFRTPVTVPAGAGYTVTATIACDVSGEVPWTLLRDGQKLASGTERLVALTPRSFSRVVPGAESPLSTLTLRLDLPGDREPANDQAISRVLVGGKRRIEYCVPAAFSPAADAMLAFLQVDERNDVRIRHDLPLAGSELQGVGAVVVNNLSLASAGATRDDLRVLADWVRDGGNLVMLGTDGAFGPGGYRDTAIEEVMPVRFRPDDAPPRRTLLLLDASQSMGDALPGGETRLARLKAAARRFVATLGNSEQAAIIGFREGLAGQIEFKPARLDALASAIDALQSGGSTHIGASLSQAVNAVPPDTRILMITDGDDVEGASTETFQQIAAILVSARIKLDVVMTGESERPWLDTLIRSGDEQVRKWSVGGDGFDALLETLDSAMADADRDWIREGPLEVRGVASPLPRIVRTSLRSDQAVRAAYKATGDGDYPVVALRNMVGRTCAICTDSWGGEEMTRFWSELRIGLLAEIDWLLENANAVNVVLNRLDQGAELVWTGSGESPSADLATDIGVARLDAPGRWLLERFPEGETLRVYHGEELLQNIPLPTLVSRELRTTGNDDTFFAEAGNSGIRVFSGLSAWNPEQFTKARSSPVDITWAPALLAVLLLLAGYALKRR